MKDLVDIVIYLKNERLSYASMLQTLLKEFSIRKVDVPTEFRLPAEWGDSEALRYTKLAKEAHFSEELLDIGAAESFAKLFFDHALNSKDPKEEWDPTFLDPKTTSCD